MSTEGCASSLSHGYSVAIIFHTGRNLCVRFLSSMHAGKFTVAFTSRYSSHCLVADEVEFVIISSLKRGPTFLSILFDVVSEVRHEFLIWQIKNYRLIVHHCPAAFCVTLSSAFVIFLKIDTDSVGLVSELKCVVVFDDLKSINMLVSLCSSE